MGVEVAIQPGREFIGGSVKYDGERHANVKPFCKTPTISSFHQYILTKGFHDSSR